MKKLLLKTITLDNRQDFEFDANTFEYTVAIPDGNPRLPKIYATAEDGVDVKVLRPIRAPHSRTATAKVVLTSGEDKTEYVLNFVQDASLGFVMQYDDRYAFAPEYSGKGKLKFSSSDESVLTVSEDGVIHAVALSSTPVTVTAKVCRTTVATLTVDRVERAPLNIFYATGQSNSRGSYDQGIDRPTEQLKMAHAPLGNTYFLYVDPNTGAFSTDEIYDFGEKIRSGFHGALTKRWHELTGEKTLMVICACDGVAIHSWAEDGRMYGFAKTVSAAVEALYSAPDSPFEINRRGFFWTHGETQMVRWYERGKGYVQDSKRLLWDNEYYDRFIAIRNNMINDLKVDFGAIVLVRANRNRARKESIELGMLTDLLPIRAAQYAVNNTTDSSLFIASRVGDYAKMPDFHDSTAYGFGFVGPQNLHYTQTGYNEQGRVLAENLYGALSPTSDRTPTELELLDSDGRTRLNDGDELTVCEGGGHRIAAIVLPLYNDAPQVKYTVTEGADICNIDVYGNIRFTAAARLGDTAEITAQSESGLVRRVRARLAAATEESANDQTQNQIG